MQARMLIFGMQVDDDLYRGIENQPSAYFSLYLTNFLSFHTLNNEIFRQRLLHNHKKARMLIFGMQVDEGLFYHGIDSQHFPAYFSLYLSTIL